MADLGRFLRGGPKQASPTLSISRFSRVVVVSGEPILERERKTMRYMMLIYTKEANLDALSPAEIEKIRNGHLAVMAESRKRGILVAVNPLARTTAATTVRMENGTVLATDGPFAETKEQLAGYYILECRDLDEAITWATKIPTQCGGAMGCVEIRPLQEVPGVPESQLRPLPAGSAA
jgi:hypothetical protein